MASTWVEFKDRIKLPSSSDFLLVTLTILSWTATGTGFSHLVQSQSVEASSVFIMIGVMIASGVVQIGMIVFFNDAYKVMSLFKKIMFSLITLVFFTISVTLSTAFYNGFLGVHKNLTSSALGEEHYRLSAHVNVLSSEIEGLEKNLQDFLLLVHQYGEQEQSDNEFGALEGPRSKYWQQVSIAAENHQRLVARVKSRLREDLEAIDVQRTEVAHQQMQILMLELNSISDKPILKEVLQYYQSFAASPLKQMPTLDKNTGQITPVATYIRGGQSGRGRWLQVKGQAEQITSGVRRLQKANVIELNEVDYIGSHGIYYRSMDIIFAIASGQFNALTKSELISLGLGGAVDLILLVLLWSRIKTAGSGSLADNIEYLKSHQAKSLEIFQNLSYKSGFTSFGAAIAELNRYGTGLLRSKFFGFYYFLPAKPSNEAVKLQRLTHHLEALDYVGEKPFSQFMLKLLQPHEKFSSVDGYRLLHIRPRLWKQIRNAVSIEVPLSKNGGSDMMVGFFIREVFSKREQKLKRDVKSVTAFANRYVELGNMPLYLFDIDHENQVVDEFCQNAADQQRLRGIIRYARELNMAPSESVEAKQLIVSLKQR